MTNLLCLTTFLSWSMLKNQSLALLMLGFPMGMRMALELHPDGWRGSRKSFKWLILLFLTTFLSWSMLKNKFLALLMLGSPMGMRMASELRPQGPDKKFAHTTLISVKNWRGGIGNGQPKGQIGRGVQGTDVLFYLDNKNILSFCPIIGWLVIVPYMCRI